jgi:hypothetical protein
MFDANVQRLSAKHRVSGILIDANLLLLLAVGQYRVDRVETFKRTAVYSRRDLGLLRELASKFEKRWTTPNILTEVDNLGRQLKTDEHADFSISMRKLVKNYLEVHHTFETAVERVEYNRLGLTDSISLLQSKDCLLLSDDLPLYIRACEIGHDAINFNHVRQG